MGQSRHGTLLTAAYMAVFVVGFEKNENRKCRTKHACWNLLPGGDKSRLWLAEDRPHLWGPGVSSAAGQGAQQGQAHPGSRVLFTKINGNLSWAHLPTQKPSIFNQSHVLIVFCLYSADHLDHIEQGQLRRDASITEDLNPISLTACNRNYSHLINPKL